MGDGSPSVTRAKLDSHRRFSRRPPFLAGPWFAIIFALGAHAAFAAGCPKMITACGCSITGTGKFTVANPLTAGASLTECLRVASPNVLLFLAGNSITGPSASSSPLKFGIHITAPGAIIIGGGSSISQFSWGVLVEGNVSALSGFTATGDAIGVVLRHGKGSQLTNFSAGNNLGDGILITNSSHNFLNDFHASNNAQNGVEISGASNFNELSGFTADSNGAAGVSVIRAGSTSTAAPSPAPANTIVFGGETDDNNTFGIAVSGSHRNTIVGNTADSNITDDLFDGSSTCSGNLWFGNTFATANHSCIN